MFRIIVGCGMVSAVAGTITLCLVVAQYLGRLARMREIKRELASARRQIDALDELAARRRARDERSGGR